MRLAIAVLAIAGAAFAAGAARAQGELVRGRPEVPEKKPQHDTRIADEDSLSEEIADDPETIPVIDEAGAPQTLRRVPPVYPDAAVRSGLQGTVLLIARVARDGSVAGARVSKSIAGLDRPAVDAVKRWTFQPVLVKGKPVETDIAIPIRFLLPADRGFDWRAARAAGAASEKAGKSGEAFARYVAGFRAAIADSAAEAESLRADVVRVAGLLATADPGNEQRVPPVEAWIAMSRGDSIAALAATPGSPALAAAAYQGATHAAPWHPPLYRRLAAALERAGDRTGAARSLALYLAADPGAPDRAVVIAALGRLTAPNAGAR